jgi:hypothetical protein
MSRQGEPFVDNFMHLIAHFHFSSTFFAFFRSKNALASFEPTPFDVALRPVMTPLFKLQQLVLVEQKSALDDRIGRARHPPQR